MTRQINRKLIIIWWKQWELGRRKSLLTPCLENLSGTLTKALEAVQRYAIRFVCSDYSQFSSVTSMQHSLGTDTLEVR